MSDNIDVNIVGGSSTSTSDIIVIPTINGSYSTPFPVTQVTPDACYAIKDSTVTQLSDNPNAPTIQLQTNAQTIADNDLLKKSTNVSSFSTISPTTTSILSQNAVSDSPIGSKANPSNTNKLITPYSEINKTKDPTANLRDVIGGSDMSVFFLMSFPSVSDLALPQDLQEKEFIVLEMDNVLSISYSTIREKFPVRTLGNINPVGFTAGPRTISGSMAFTIFCDDPLGELRNKVQDTINQVTQSFESFSKNKLSTEQSTDAIAKYKKWLSFKSYYKNILGSTGSLMNLDSLPLFHVMVMGVNERGTFSKFILKDVTIIDENQYQGTQQPNAVNKVTFVAKDLVPMAKFTNTQTIIKSLTSVDESFINGTYNAQFNYQSEITGTKALDSISKDLNSSTTVRG